MFVRRSGMVGQRHNSIEYSLHTFSERPTAGKARGLGAAGGLANSFSTDSRGKRAQYCQSAYKQTKGRCVKNLMRDELTMVAS
jgi:hypothetical protein